MRLLIVVVVCFCWSVQCFAACIGSSPNWTAASVASSDVADCVTSASSGDTINIPSGFATWAAGAVTIASDKPLQLLGSGSGESGTVITLGGSTVISVSEYVTSGGVAATRISGFRFLSPLDSKYTAITIKGQGWRIDNNYYLSNETDSSTGGFFVIATGSDTTVQPRGVINNNTIVNGKIDVSFNGGNQYQAWIDDLDLGGVSSVYIEDNSFYISDSITTKHLCVDNGYAAKMVIRYNTFHGCDVMTHGLQSAGDRGPRKAEFYGNSFSQDQDGVQAFIEYISGTGVAFFNLITGSDGYSNFALALDQKRGNDAVGCLGMCDGNVTHTWDGNNDGESGWPCRDQIGTGLDASPGWTGLNAACAGTPTTQTRYPLYAWTLLGAGNGNAVLNGDATHIQANRDYYYTDATHCPEGGEACSQGVGCGTLANRPATCTTGVGYWATDQSCSDLTGMVGANPSTPISGTLFKCTATNTWTSYYTPYTYPHPLRGTTETALKGSILGSGAFNMR